jgi:hypothetical protein
MEQAMVLSLVKELVQSAWCGTINCSKVKEGKGTVFYGNTTFWKKHNYTETQIFEIC